MIVILPGKGDFRMRAGEKITVCDGAGTDYICELSDLAKDCVKARVVSKEASQTELSPRLVLFQGMPKKDKMEWIIQKAVELGITAFVSCTPVARS